VNDATRILDHLQARQDQMVDRVFQYARLETPSHDPLCQGPLLDLIAGDLQAIGYRCRRLAGHVSGGQLLAIPKRRQRAAPLQLLLGHCDTVWPHGSLQKMTVHVADGRLYGPGVYDMKGGLVQAIFALTALHELKLTPAVTPIVFINTDEETGSGESVRQIHRLAKIVQRTFVMEPALEPGGRLKTARKGVGHFTVTIIGRAAHAGLDPEQGISAILESSHIIQSLFAVNDPDRGMSVNVGTISGGTQANVIAAECGMTIDVRVRTLADAAQVEHAIRSLTATTPGVEIRVSGRVGRPPLEPTPRNQQLWLQAVQAASALGLEIDQGAAGGGSDGNFTSLHTATLDGLGAVGNGAHALHEHLVIKTMPERAALLACLLMS
jgi:glutamate carboxypeptidase